jgi:hypothetical protein
LSLNTILRPSVNDLVRFNLLTKESEEEELVFDCPIIEDDDNKKQLEEF